VFTGIVEAVGRVVSITPAGEHVRLVVDEPGLAAEVRLGDSVLCNGACLTIAEVGSGELVFDAIHETLQKTNLGDLEVAGSLNLERAMRADGRFDGHIVQGHVDETGTVERWEREGSDVRLHVRVSPAFADQLVPKGSVTIDGVSLTVVEVQQDGFDVALIPHTLSVTTLGQLEPGGRVNLEADVLGKYVKQYLERVVPGIAPGSAAAG